AINTTTNQKPRNVKSTDDDDFTDDADVTGEQQPRHQELNHQEPRKSHDPTTQIEQETNRETNF
ncbi:hypothetical protein A2U01_0102759, partial [Trifolium medium]|nr:hypothetical protein [Trifolium medium]